MYTYLWKIQPYFVVIARIFLKNFLLVRVQVKVNPKEEEKGILFLINQS
jgi:hypothetical protein